MPRTPASPDNKPVDGDAPRWRSGARGARAAGSPGRRRAAPRPRGSAAIPRRGDSAAPTSPPGRTPAATSGVLRRSTTVPASLRPAPLAGPDPRGRQLQRLLRHPHRPALRALRHPLRATRRGAEFCMGPDPDRPNACLTAVASAENPRADQTILEMDRDASTVLPGVQPIPILTEVMDNGWIGRTAEAAGLRPDRVRRLQHSLVHGRAHRPADQRHRDHRRPEPAWGLLRRLGRPGDGPGVGRLRPGGGRPVQRRRLLRRPRQLHPDRRLRGLDRGFTGPTVVEGAACGAITAEGRCQGGMAMWCEGDELQTEQCGVRCGFDGRQRRLPRLGGRPLRRLRRPGRV
ncbi:MAG: hypothetical protein R3F43_20685 [bacterium]